MTASFLSTSRRIALVAAALGVTAACDPAPVLTVQGQVESALEASDTSADDGVAVAVVWVGGSESDIVFPIADLATVSGDFPASYSIDVRPPEEASLFELATGTRIGVGFVVALPPGAAIGDAVQLEQMLGVTNRHVILYAPSADAVTATGNLNATLRDVQEGFNLIDMALTTPEFETCKTDAVAAIDGCHADCDVTCDPDSAEDPGCDLCRAPCEELSDQFHACDQQLSRTVPTDTSLALSLDPDAVAASAVWSIFDIGGAGVDDSNEEPGDDSNDNNDGNDQPGDEPTEEPTEPDDGQG